MAWFKVYQTLPDHRKTMSVARQLNVDSDLVVGKLVRLWSWGLDNATDDGELPPVTHQQLGKIAGWPRRPDEFVGALINAGYIDLMEDGVLVLHDWEHYAGKLNEKRSLNRDRQEKSRSNKRERHATVTRDNPSDVTRDVTHLSRAQERRVEKEKTKDSSSKLEEAARDAGFKFHTQPPKALQEPDPEGFVAVYRRSYETEKGKSPPGSYLIAATQLEDRFGRSPCLTVAPLLGWTKSPKYYIGALEDLENGIPAKQANGNSADNGARLAATPGPSAYPRGEGPAELVLPR